MDLIKQIGELALASRLKRLSDRFAQDVGQFFKEQDIDFEPRWFPVYYLLSQRSPLSIVDISRELGITHPAVNQIAGEMIKNGLISPMKCSKDKRKRLLSLTGKGENLLPQLQPLWADVEGAVKDLIASTGFDVMAMLERMEWELDYQDFYSRIQQKTKQSQRDCVEILEYSPELEPFFKSLNVEWIEKYFEMEAVDEYLLSNARQEIIDKDGFIFFARYENDIVGTCALVRHHSKNLEYELIKMAVTEKAQGKQIGRRLMQAAIEKAKAMRADAIHLETNSKLLPAINLYRKCGFETVPFDAGSSEFDRTDMRMTLNLVAHPV